MSDQNSLDVAEKVAELGLELSELRDAISEEYKAVANEPEKGFHFHTGRPLAQMLGYEDEWLQGIPDSSTFIRASIDISLPSLISSACLRKLIKSFSSSL